MEDERTTEFKPVPIYIDENEAARIDGFIETALFHLRRCATVFDFYGVPLNTETAQDACNIKLREEYVNIETNPPFNPNDSGKSPKRVKTINVYLDCPNLAKWWESKEANAVAALAGASRAERETAQTRCNEQREEFFGEILKIMKDATPEGRGHLSKIVAVSDDGKITTSRKIRDYAKEAATVYITSPRSMKAYNLAKEIAQKADELNDLLAPARAEAIAFVQFDGKKHRPKNIDFDFYFKRDERTR